MPGSGGGPGDRRRLLAEIEELRVRLAEAEDTLQAIREGDVDAIVVSGARGEQVFSLTGTEHVYRLIVETMSEAAFTVSLDGRVLFCNRQFARLLRAPQESIVGCRLEELVPPAERPQAAEVLAGSRRGTVRRRLVLRSADGAEVPVHLSAALLHTSEGESVCAVATDLTELESSARLIRELRLRQEALQESEHRWAVTLGSIGDAVIATDPAGRITFLNAVARELTGWTSQEAVGRAAKEVFRVVDEASRQPLADPVSRVLAEGRPVGLANRTLLVRRDGSEMPIDDSGAPIQDESGRVLGVVLVFRDVRERRRAGDALRQARDDAETAKIAAETARLEAERANRAKSEFLAHMSHEIRTPLSAIIGLSEVLLSRLQEEDGRQLLAMIHDSARSMLTLIGEILDFSRIEAGKVELRQAPFGLRGLLEKLLDFHRLPAGQKGLGLGLEVDEELADLLEGDEELISRVLQNLLTNAVKYTERGSVRLRVRRWAEGPVDGRLWVLFEVADTGIGIPDSARPRLFESFTRVHGSLTRIHHEGSGLGLAIARQLVEFMGGEIGVRSTEGEGSTFHFCLPLRRASGEGAVEGAGAGCPAREALRDLAALPPLRVLLAEDNRMNRLFLRSAFEEGGHRVETAENGRQALDLLQAPGGEPPFDLVLMDIQMPVMDGLEAIRAIRAMEGERGRMPVIALTAFAVKGDERRFLQAGASGYVSKPVDFGRLAGEIRRVLEPVTRRTGPGRSAAR